MIAISSAGPKIFPSQESLEKKLSLIGPDSLGKKDKILLTFPPEEYPQHGKLIFPLYLFNQDQKKIYDFLKNQTDYFVFARYNLYSGIDLAKDSEQIIAIHLGKLVKTFNPFGKPSNLQSNFPVHLDNPIVDLWTLNRMGPFIEIYKMNN